MGQIFPETVARHVARPMEWLSSATRPCVRLLSASTDAVLRLMGLPASARRVRSPRRRSRASLEEGVDAGVIEEHEHQMVRNVFRLDERQIGSMMIPARRDRVDGRRRAVAQVLAIISDQPHCATRCAAAASTT